jgi:NADPH:quinone reductase
MSATKAAIHRGARAPGDDRDGYAMVIDQAGGPELFHRVDVDLRKPKKGEALIRHTAIGLNFIDVYQRSGLYPPPGGHPAILGSEGAGVVLAVGAGVTRLKKGDRIAYTTPGGAYASHRIIAADRLVKVPKGVSDEEAAGAMLKGLTAHYLLHDCYKARAGDTVLVHAAAGGVGQLLGQWLKAKGVTAIGTAGGRDKCEIARSLGYDHVIDYRKNDFVEQVMKFTRKAGVAAVYDSVGKSTYPGSLLVLRKFGAFVSFGQSSGMIENFKLADLAANGSLFATRPTLFHFISEEMELERRARQLFRAISAGHVSINVNQSFPLAELREAHRALEGRETTGQTILIP